MNIVVCALALAASCHSGKSHGFVAATETTKSDLLLGNESVNPVASLHIRPSHSCWLNAFQAMEETEYGRQRHAEPKTSLGRATCADMTHEHQQFLAFELTRCHMESVNRPLVDQNCDISRTMHVESLRVCLGNMSDFGLNAYTHFFTYINQLCLRLTQELSAARNFETALMLNEASKLAVEKISEIKLMQKQAFEQFQEQQKQFMTHQQDKLSETTRHVKNSMSEIESKKKEILEHQEHMRQKQHEFEDRQDKLLVRFDGRIKQQEQEMKDIITQVAGAASEGMQPLLDIESLVLRATMGFHWFTSFVHFLGTMNLAWLLTLDKRCRRSRRTIFSIIVVEILAEFVIHWMSKDGLLSSHDGDKAITFLRSSAFYLECGAYLLGIFVSLFAAQYRGHDGNSDHSGLNSYHVELVSQLEEHKAQVREEQIKREERLVRILSRSIQETSHTAQQASFMHSRQPVECPLPPCLQRQSQESFESQSGSGNASSTQRYGFLLEGQCSSPTVRAGNHHAKEIQRFAEEPEPKELQWTPPLACSRDLEPLNLSEQCNGADTAQEREEPSNREKKRKAEELQVVELKLDNPARPETKKQKVDEKSGHASR